MTRGERIFKVCMILLAGSASGLMTGGFIGCAAGFILFLILDPRFFEHPHVLFGDGVSILYLGIVIGILCGSVIGFLIGLLYLFPKARRLYWSHAIIGASVGLLLSRAYLASSQIARGRADWMSEIEFVGVVSGILCAVVVALLLQRVGVNRLRL